MFPSFLPNEHSHEFDTTFQSDDVDDEFKLKEKKEQHKKFTHMLLFLRFLFFLFPFNFLHSALFALDVQQSTQREEECESSSHNNTVERRWGKSTLNFYCISALGRHSEGWTSARKTFQSNRRMLMITQSTTKYSLFLFLGEWERVFEQVNQARNHS